MEDRLATVVLLDLTGLVVAAVVVPLVPVPAPASRGLLVASVVLHLGYELLLLVAYRAGDLSQVYPVARGTAPLLVAAYGLVLWAQRRGALAVVAALRETSVLVAALIGTLVFGERFGRRRVLAAALLAAGIVALNVPR